MKKIMLLLVAYAIICGPSLHAQKVRIGFSAGPVLAQFKTKAGNQKNNSNMRLGFTLGVVTDIPLSDQFSFQPALHFVQKGGKEKEEAGGSTASYSVSLNYMEIPINFVYRSKGVKGHFIAGLGPSVSYGISGKAKITANGKTETENVNFGSSAGDDLKAFETGGNILAGYEKNNGTAILLNYNTSFNNLVNDDPGRLHLGYLGLRIVYYLKHK